MNNSSMIMVKYRGPTNTRGSFMELQTWDLSHYNNEKVCKKSIGYDYACNGTDDQALKYFKSIGLKVLGVNTRHPDVSVYLFKWDIEKMAKIFGYEKEIK